MLDIWPMPPRPSRVTSPVEAAEDQVEPEQVLVSGLTKSG